MQLNRIVDFFLFLFCVHFSLRRHKQMVCLFSVFKDLMRMLIGSWDLPHSGPKTSECSSFPGQLRSSASPLPLAEYCTRSKGSKGGCSCHLPITPHCTLSQKPSWISMGCWIPEKAKQLKCKSIIFQYQCQRLKFELDISYRKNWMLMIHLGRQRTPQEQDWSNNLGRRGSGTVNATGAGVIPDQGHL